MAPLSGAIITITRGPLLCLAENNAGSRAANRGESETTTTAPDATGEKKNYPSGPLLSS